MVDKRICLRAVRVHYFVQFVSTSPLGNVTNKKEYSRPEERCVISKEVCYVIFASWTLVKSLYFYGWVMAGTVSSRKLLIPMVGWNHGVL